MKSHSLLVIIIITGLVFVTLCFETIAISKKVYISGLAAKADYVMLGFVSKKKLIFKEKRDGSGKIIPTVETEGSIYSIGVKEVFFTKEPSWGKKEEIYIFQRETGINSAILLPNKSYLLFLKEASVNHTFVKKYGLPRDNYFTVAEGRQGQIDSSDLLYLETARTFFRIRGIKNEKQKLKEWEKLLESDNLELRKAARDELEKTGSINKTNENGQ